MSTAVALEAVSFRGNQTERADIPVSLALERGLNACWGRGLGAHPETPQGPLANQTALTSKVRGLGEPRPGPSWKEGSGLCSRPRPRTSPTENPVLSPVLMLP